ncbi:MAG: hypothetical protein ACYS0E_01835 [Planctomycetota bacterium]
MLRRIYALTLLLPLCAGCSGGGGDSSGDAQGPPPPPFAVLRETGLEVGNQFAALAVVDRLVVIGVSEPESGQDLNGDGDRNDLVAHQLDVDSLQSINLGIAIRGQVHASDRHFVFLSREDDQGQDLNADGDSGDAVWHVYDPQRAVSANNPFNTQLATPPPGRPCIGVTGGFVLVASESAQGASFNADGDLLDDVAFSLSGETFIPTPLSGPPHAKGTELVGRDNRVLICGSEADDQVDFNGDGDMLDTVLGAVEFDAAGDGLYRPVGSLNPRAVLRNSYALAGSKAIYLIDEAAAGATDLNRDGDATDGIIAIFDFDNALGEILPNDASLGPFPLAGSFTYGFAASDHRVIVGIDEAAQGRDFNIDQDQADVILAWIDLENAPGRLNNLGLTLGTAKPAANGELGLVTVSEAASALVVGVDYNQDGDTGDEGAFVLRMTSPPGAVINLGLAAGSLSLHGTDAIIGVIEAAQFGTDFNGDTDTEDLVPFVADLALPAPPVRSLGIAAHAHVLGRTPTELRVGLLIPEQPLTARADVNADGDSTDNAVFWIDLDAQGRIRLPTPHLAGIAGFITSPPVLLDPDNLLFATSERMAGEDLNGDGDEEDTVLRISFRPSPPTE